ncbi:MAG: hypothetical protein JRJ79_10205 [Deltaproteobacteria bacterium]|nr:hypothetical protein [Deltaproteobacteria bacterium]
MAKKTFDAILLYSDDIWNNDREQDFTQAKVVGKGGASEAECETFFPCGLYYEKDTTDDLGYRCLNITSDEMDVGEDKLQVITVTLLNAEGRKINLQFPADSRKFPVAFGGETGNAITFYIDGAETYRSSKGAKEKAKKFIESRIEKLRNCEAPFAAESMEMGMEEMASEFSVERINPTPVTGKADMKAESFGAEENLAVADVDIHDGMNIPAGSGAIVGQAIPETDFTPFGASAEGYDDKLDESLGMSEKESKMKQSDKDRRDESKGTEKADDERAYSRVGTMDKSAENLAVADVEVWDGMVLPEGTGSIIGQAVPETDFTPFGVSAEDEIVGQPQPADPRVSPLNDGLYSPSDSPDLSAEENLAIQDVEVWDGMVLPEGTGNVMGQMTPSTDFTPFGVSAEQDADPMPNESAIIGQTSDGTPYTRFGYAAENLAVADVDIHDGMNIPAGSGAIVGQAIPETDFTPFGASAESYMEETFMPDGDGEVIGAITAETDFTPFGASAEDMEAEAFGGDLASLDDYNGIESVRVEAPIGHGVTQNLGAEDMEAYGGIMGVAAAFLAGMAFRHWSNGKIDGDDAPDSTTPAEESDDAPEA